MPNAKRLMLNGLFHMRIFWISVPATNGLDELVYSSFGQTLKCRAVKHIFDLREWHINLVALCNRSVLLVIIVHVHIGLL